MIPSHHYSELLDKIATFLTGLLLAHGWISGVDVFIHFLVGILALLFWIMRIAESISGIPTSERWKRFWKKS